MRDDLSFIELSARERARNLLDSGSFRELLGHLSVLLLPGWSRRA